MILSLVPEIVVFAFQDPRNGPGQGILYVKVFCRNFS